MKNYKEKLLRFERKVLGRIYEPTRNQNNGEFEQRKTQIF